MIPSGLNNHHYIVVHSRAILWVDIKLHSIGVIPRGLLEPQYPQQLPVLWFHIPNIAIASYAPNIPEMILAVIEASLMMVGLLPPYRALVFKQTGSL